MTPLQADPQALAGPQAVPPGVPQEVLLPLVAVRTDEGELVLVDLSAVRSLVGSFTPGLPITVYGTPGESKFQAMGVILSNTKALARPVVVPQRR